MEENPPPSAASAPDALPAAADPATPAESVSPPRPAESARPAGSAESAGSAARPTPLVRVGSPESVLAVIPGLLGFHPDRSLVVVGAGPPRGRIQVAFRYDLPEPPDVPAAAKIASHAAAILARQQLTLAVAVGYGPAPMVTPVADALVGELRRADIVLHDLLRVEHGRYWSYTCRDPRCCPADGVPFDPAAHPAAAMMSAAGNKALRGRASLAATIAPLRGLTEESMRQATRRAERRAVDLIRKSAASGCGRSGALERVAGEGLRAVSEAIDAYRGGGRITDSDRIAWLGVALTDLRVRDDAWARMLPGQEQAHLRLWTDVVRRVPARYVPAPASLLAFTAWQAGNGALANVAAQRALAADPEYSMALLLLEAIGAGLPPSAARLPMTPEEVAASYSRTEARAGRDVRPAGAVAKPARARRGPSGGIQSPAGGTQSPSGGARSPSGGTRGGASDPSGGTRGPTGSSRGPSGGSRSAPGGARRSAGGIQGSPGPRPAARRSPARGRIRPVR